jgi:hypothetical protein
MLRLLYLVTFTLASALLSTLAISCASTCETAAASGDAADLDAEDDTDACRLRCGDYGSCSERTPYCCRGICQAESCK